MKNLNRIDIALSAMLIINSVLCCVNANSGDIGCALLNVLGATAAITALGVSVLRGVN